MYICWCIWFNLSQGSSLNVTDQVSCPHKTKDNITVLNTWIFIFLDRTKEDNKNLDRIVEGIPWVQSQWNFICSSWTQIFEPYHTFVLLIFMMWFCPALYSPGMNICKVFSAFTSRQTSYNFSVFLPCTNIQWNLPFIYGANWYKPLVQGTVMADNLPIFRNLISTG